MHLSLILHVIVIAGHCLPAAEQLNTETHWIIGSMPRRTHFGMCCSLAVLDDCLAASLAVIALA
jgi:hypothetical protein